MGGVSLRRKNSATGSSRRVLTTNDPGQQEQKKGKKERKSRIRNVWVVSRQNKLSKRAGGSRGKGELEKKGGREYRRIE